MFPRILKFVLSLALAQALTACGTNRQISEIDERGSGPATPTSTLGLGKGPIHSKKGWLQKVEFHVAEEMPEDMIEGLIASAKTWNDALGTNLLVYKGRIGGSLAKSPKTLYESLDDEYTVFYFDRDWRAKTGKSIYTLATTVWENSPTNPDAIVKGDIRFNGENYVFGNALTQKPDSSITKDFVDVQTVCTHEIGHLIGLDHTTYDEDPDSVMHAQTPIGFNFAFRKLSNKDIERVLSIYRQ